MPAVIRKVTRWARVGWVSFACVMFGSRGLLWGQGEEARQEKLKQEMSDLWKETRAFLKSQGEPRELKRVAEPVFHYVESAREQEHVGTVWVWEDEGRPVALFTQSRNIKGGVGGFEIVALTEGLSAVTHDGWEWKPPSSCLELKPFPKAPAAAETETLRLIQIKGLARQFAVSELVGQERFELRQLPTPVHRYRDEAGGLVDGAFVLFCHGTNPEALLAIECRRDAGGTGWFYGFVPLAGAEVTARLNDEVVWTKAATAGPRRQEAYSTWLESRGR